MANVLVQDSSLTAIGNAIREKNGSSTTYKPAEMAAAISAIATGGSGGGITQWSKLYYSSSASTLDLSSIVSDYSKVDFIIMVKNSTTNNYSVVYFPNLEPVADKAAGYTSLLFLDSSTSSEVFGQRGRFSGPADYTTDTTYYFKKSEIEANQPLALYYLTSTASVYSMEQVNIFIPANYSVLVFYHD